MIAALDVHYNDVQGVGNSAAVVFQRWDDPSPTAEYTAVSQSVPPYVPGQFFRRELPCLLAVLNKIKEPIDVVLIDGYVKLGDQPGLGQHLFAHCSHTTPVIGIAKTRFHGAPAKEVFRGVSKSPLYVTSIGVSADDAALGVQKMHGSHRIPALLKRADQLARQGRILS